MASPAQIKECLLGILLIVFGALVIAVPNVLELLVGSAFIILGLVHFIPAEPSK
jgi:hypothetical protein